MSQVTVAERLTADEALCRALDELEAWLRASGWTRNDEVEWSLTYGHYSVFAVAEEAAVADGHVDVHLEATTGFLPWKRKRRQRLIAL